MKPIKHLRQIELAARWNLSPRTLERWRSLGEGPCYLRLGGRVVYRLKDVKKFEMTQLRKHTADHPSEIPLKDLQHMAIGDIAVLPSEHLTHLQDEADETLRRAKLTCNWLASAIALRAKWYM